MSQNASGTSRCDVDRVALIGLDRLLDDREVAALTGRSRSTLKGDRIFGRGIPFVKIGRLARYRQSDVAAYLAALPTRHSTGAAA